MAFMIREIVADDHGNSWELDRFGPYASQPDATAQAQHLASRFEIPGDTDDRYNGESDWWGRDEGDPLTHHFQIEPLAPGAHTLVTPNGVVCWGRLEVPRGQVAGGGRR